MSGTTAHLEDLQWLVGPDAERLLEDLAGSSLPLHTQAARLRQRHSSTRVSLLLEQVELRQRGGRKFRMAEQMYFTKVGLEQATDELIAQYKAARFTGRESLVDICCGIGGDLLSLARVGSAVGIDRDPAVGVVARANIRTLGLQADVRQEDATPGSLAACDAWHADPDRRPAGRRTTRPASHSPDQSLLDAMLSVAPDAAIKLAPATTVGEHWQTRAELEWISRGGECRQQVAWFGQLAVNPGLRTATRVAADGQLAGTFTAKRSAAPRVAKQLGTFLYEPDPAVLAAGLTDALAAQHGMSRVAPAVGYLTSDRQIDHPLARGFAVREVLPARPKAIAKRLRALDIGSVEIKVRGAKVSPEALRQELKLRGEARAVLLVFPIAARRVAVLADRLPDGP